MSAAAGHRTSEVHSIPALPGSVTASVGRVGWLEDWRLAAGLVALAAAVVAVWTVVAVRGRRAGRRPGHPVLRRLGLGTLVGVLVLAGAGAAVNSYVGYAPDLGSLSRSAPSLVGLGKGGGSGRTTVLAGTGRYPARLTSLVAADPADHIPAARTWVYLPPGYSDPANARVRYPVVYLVHGWPGTSYDWFAAGRAGQTAALMQQQGLIRPLILVGVDASGGMVGDSECLDSTVGGARIETYLTRFVVSQVDGAFRTVADRTGRAIGGVSSGGFCALNLGLRDQGTYGASLPMMPYGDPGRHAIHVMLGDVARLAWQNTPSDYEASVPLRAPQSWFFGTGRDDVPTYRVVSRAAAVLSRRGDFVAVRVNDPGLGHNWREAKYELPYALQFASARLARSSPAAPAAETAAAGSPALGGWVGGPAAREVRLSGASRRPGR